MLVADDEENQRAGLAKMIQSWGFAVDTASDGQEALEKLGQIPVHVLVTDLMMPRMDGFELLKRLGAQGNLPPTIVLTAFGNIETAVQTMHDLGAFWFLEKPIQPSALKVLLERAATQSRLAEEAERLQRQLLYQGVLVDLVGTCSAMQQVFSLIRQVAPSKAAVLVTGESGTGKELVARAVHHLSPRRDGPFVAINCAALPETLMESELFGHEKGAFTGAVERRAGCFELAQHGTLAAGRTGRNAGGNAGQTAARAGGFFRAAAGRQIEIAVDVRVIASTNKVLEEALRKGELREDLYYRLERVPNRVAAAAPARRRSPAAHRARSSRCSIESTRRAWWMCIPDVMDQFKRYSWPGNVRELRNVLERAVILAGEGTITTHHLPRDFGVPAGSRPAQQVVEPDAVRLPVGTTVGEAEKALIQLTLQHTKNNKTRAAEILGISLKTLFNKLKEYGAAEAEAGHRSA